MNHLIEKQSQLDQLAPLFATISKDNGFVAVDTEFFREKTFRAKLCLVQLGIGDDQYCIDVLAIDNLSLLANLFSDQSVLKLLHASRQDMEVIYQTLNVLPKPIFDTQLAAAFVGYDMQIGHTALVKDRTDVDLPKSQARTDWTRRPLSEAQIEYAADDVAYLQEIYQGLLADLEKRDRLAWYNQEIDDYYALDKYEVNPSIAYKRLSGGGLKKPQQYRLKALAEWREDYAHARDIPRTWVLKDDQLFALATSNAITSDAIIELDVFGKKAVNRLAPKVAKVLAEVEVGDELIWQYLEPLDKKDRGNCSSMMKELKKVAEQRGVAQGLLATRKDVEGLYRHRQSSKLLQTWRAELIGQHLLQFAAELS